MIQISISSSDEITIVKIAEFLVAESLVVNVKLLAKIQQCSKTEMGVIMENKFMLSAITKGSLFNLIEKRINENYPDNEFEITGVPVINMKWEQSETLAAEI